MINWRNLLLLLAGLAVLVILYSVLGVEEVIAAARQLHPGLFGAYLCVACIVCMGYSTRWYMIAGTLGQRPPLSRFVAARLAGDAVGSLVPIGRVGGDPVRVGLLYGEGLAGARASAGVLLDRIVEIIGNSVCAVTYVSVFALTHSVHASWSLPVAFVAVLGPLVALAALLYRLWRGARPLSELFELLVARPWPRARGWVAVLARVEDDLSHFVRERPAVFIGAVAFSLLIEAVILVEYSLLFAAFGLDLDLPTLLVILVLTGLVRAVPVPAGLGALEASQVTLLAVVQGRPEAGLIVGTVLRLNETVWMTAGLIALSAQGVSIAQLRMLASTHKASA
jgi:glycosyltransferase 2 family protein